MESVPADFRFSVKVPKTITHAAKLVDTAPLVEPKLEFDARVARGFFSVLRRHHDGAVALEPRHASWFATTRPWGRGPPTRSR